MQRKEIFIVHKEPIKNSEEEEKKIIKKNKKQNINYLR